MLLSIARKIYSFLIDTLQSLLIAAAVFLVVYQFLFRPFEVKGDSMIPNFANNDYVLTNLISLNFQNPELGDVIVFKAPRDTEKAFIKRVIGTPGDKITLENGSIYLNEVLLNEEQYLEKVEKTQPGSFLAEGQTIIVPKDHYFVLGDNRNFSSDSREWGFVNKKLITGFSFFVYWPIDKMGIIKNPYDN